MPSYNSSDSTSFPSESLRKKKKPRRKNYSLAQKIGSGKLVSFITIVIPNGNAEIIDALEKVSATFMKRRELIQLDITTSIPQSALSELVVRKKDEKYLMIFLDFSKQPSFVLDKSDERSLSSNSFEVRIIKQRIDDDHLNLTLQNWILKYLGTF